MTIFSAATGFEFGDNEASVPKTEDNGVAQISFQVHIRDKFIVDDCHNIYSHIINPGFAAADCLSLGLSQVVQMA